jgi:hypothetical protein
MRKVVLGAVAAALTLAVVGPTLAGAAHGRKVHKCKVNVTGRFAQVKVKSGAPPASGADTDVGSIDGKLCGKRLYGATRNENKYPTPGSFTSKATAFGPKGEIKARFKGTGKVNPDGSISFTGSGKVTGGTGIYKHATGSFSFTGTEAAGSTVAQQHIKGKVKY